MEIFYIDFIESGTSRKASFVLIIRTKDQLEMYQDSSFISLSVRVIKLEVIFRKALYKTTFALQSLTSSEIQPLQESVNNKTNDSESEEKMLNEYASKSAPIVFRKSSQIVVNFGSSSGHF